MTKASWDVPQNTGGIRLNPKETGEEFDYRIDTEQAILAGMVKADERLKAMERPLSSARERVLSLEMTPKKLIEEIGFPKEARGSVYPAIARKMQVEREKFIKTMHEGKGDLGIKLALDYPDEQLEMNRRYREAIKALKTKANP